MLALSTALPHSEGVGRWEDIVPALPSIDQLTADWEQMMLQYIHHITDTPLPGTDSQGPMSSVEPATESLPEVLVQQSPEAPAALESTSSDALTRFHLAVAQVDSYREVAIRQKQELSELREQVDKEQKRSLRPTRSWMPANARAIRMRDRLEDLEETVHRYRARAHVAEELIRKYPEDEGLYEVDLPSLSSLQNQLTASEAMVRRLATFAHRLYSADPLLHHHNTYVGGLIEAIITLLSRSLLHPPERMRTVVELALEYLSQGGLPTASYTLDQ
ncbi:hypothetical protein LENED_005534 [Lentinula edodes]|uniref:Uncharacterized protein n=1 Tax=Lentinula edodes TaxID=5353 RepID=A0A1Q3E972_LENED|nr:hypothetical protein LENED_005534 [Lentinula edodes]